LRRFSLWVVVLCCACGGGGSSSARAPRPAIEFAPTGGGWAGVPVEDGLGSVAHNGLGYTGEIDRYELVTPAPGRLLVSLDWDHEADFDLILAADALGETRLGEGTLQDYEPEYVGVDVARGQTVWVFVAGFEGDPGDYTLETLLLPFDVPEFAVEAAPDPEVAAPRNRPFVLRFTAPLDPEQDPAERLVFVGPGVAAQGTWCVDGHDLVFLPALPETPGAAGGLTDGGEYTLQLPRASRGPRAESGEYLAEVWGARYRFEGYVDDAPEEFPRVLGVTPDPAAPWTGEPIEVRVHGALDPATVRGTLALVDAAGAETPIDAAVTLRQRYECGAPLVARIRVEPLEPVLAGSRLRLRLPPDVRRLGGTTRITGPVPQLGAGYQIEYRLP
jgi:hypothetical protein